jgi:hypothetical protein
MIEIEHQIWEHLKSKDINGAVPLYETIWLHNAEEHNFNLQHHEDLGSYLYLISSQLVMTKLSQLKTMNQSVS